MFGDQGIVFLSRFSSHFVYSIIISFSNSYQVNGYTDGNDRY